MTIRNTYDIAVLGLGAMGSMAAWRAAARGASVIGIEQYGIAHDRGSSHGGSRIFRKTLFEGREYIPVVERAHTLWQRLEAESGTTLLRRSGGLCIGPRDGALIDDALRCAKEADIEHLLLEPDELAARYPQHATIAGDVAVLEPGAGVLDPEAAIAAALSRAAAAGARLHFQTQVTALRHDDGGVRVETGDGTFNARRAIVATGAWFTDLLPDLALPLRVQRSLLSWFTGPDRESYRPEVFPVFIRESGTVDGWGIPDVDGRGVKVGAGPTAPKRWLDHARDNDYPVSESDLLPAEEFCRTAFPGLTPRAVAAAACMNSKTPDGDFVIGVPSGAPALVLAGGMSGHGFKHAAGIGDITVDLALDGACDIPLDRFSPDRFAGKES
ncbi:N-methyl-L-tryptophan oxidase [Nonomuraea sp. NPDC049141]|uniref:N-methyl-L-tryptophan oxidase n=1 Tax=unclassified Nonomuraea TaxID=2593643 RepID=UPI0033EBE59E